MKRIALISVIAAGAIIPASSAAEADRSTSARGGNDFFVSFDIANDSNGNPRVIRNFQFSGFTVPCNNGIIHLSGQKPRMPVNGDGEFSGAITEGRGTVLIAGDFRRNNTQIVGSLDANGRFGQGRGCSRFGRWIAE